MSLLSLGDKLILVSRDNRGREPQVYDVEVVKVGRRWATIQGVTGLSRAWPHERVDRATLEVDGGGYSARWAAFTSREAWGEHVDRREALQELRRLLQWGGSSVGLHLSAAELKAIVARLRGPEE